MPPNKPLAYRRRKAAQTTSAIGQTPASLLGQRNGDWSGRSYSAGAELNGQVSFPIQAKNCRFDKLVLENIVFQEPVDFSGSVFEGGLVLRNVKFEKQVSFQECRFNGPFSGTQFQCENSVMFYRADFAGETLFRANFRASANFNESIFRESARFSGWRSVSGTVNITLPMIATATGIVSTGRPPTLSQRISAVLRRARQGAVLVVRRAWKLAVVAATKLTRRANLLRRRFAKSDDTKFFPIFEKEGHFEGVAFLKPDQTVFSEADLSQVYFRGTNLRGIRFQGVNFWQSRLGRSGLYDEIFVRFSGDGPFRHQQMPVLEETCRNMRVALEENRSFAAATDFYVAEMEALRAQLCPIRRHLLSVPALYCAVSRYGSSVGVALRTLALFLILHLSISLLLESRIRQVDGTEVATTALSSAKVLLYQPSESMPNASGGPQAWTDLVFKIIGAAQLAMIVLAFRTRLKRH